MACSLTTRKSIATSATEVTIDAIMLDIQMKQMNGDELCRLLRPQSHPVPIIAMTGALAQLTSLRNTQAHQPVLINAKKLDFETSGLHEIVSLTFLEIKPDRLQHFFRHQSKGVFSFGSCQCTTAVTE